MAFPIFDFRFSIRRPPCRVGGLHWLTGLLAHWVTPQSKIPNLKSKIAAEAAFTLVEMMTAVGLTVIMLTIIAAIFTQASTCVTVSDAQTEVYQNARVIHDFLVRDLSGACLNASFDTFKGFNNIDPVAYAAISAKGGTDILLFLTGSANQGSSGTEQNLCLVAYYLKDDNTLRRAEITDSTTLRDPSTFDPNTATYYDIGFNVRNLQLRYWDPLAASPDWTDTWATGSGAVKYLPTCVEVTLKISDEQRRLGPLETVLGESVRVMTFSHVIRLPESPK